MSTRTFRGASSVNLAPRKLGDLGGMGGGGSGRWEGVKRAGEEEKYEGEALSLSGERPDSVRPQIDG